MIILRQKEFNIITDIKYSGIKRALKKNIGRARRNLAYKIDESIEKDLINKRKSQGTGRKLGNRLHNNPRVTSLAEAEIRMLKESGNTINRLPSGPSVNLDSGKFNFPLSVSLGEVKHEEGHLRNFKGKNGKRAKKASILGQVEENFNDLNKIDVISSTNKDLVRTSRKRDRDLLLARSSDPELTKQVNDYFNSSKLSDSFDRFRRGIYLVQDERNASKWAINNIKDQVSPNVLDLEKRRQRAGNDSYKHSVLASSKIPIRNKIQIPSRKGDFKFNKLVRDDKRIANKNKTK